MTKRHPLTWIVVVVPVAAMVVGVYLVFARGLARKPTLREMAAPREQDAPFLVAKPHRRRMPRPERFDAPLPASDKELYAYEGGDERFPPTGHVTSSLCAGDEEMLARFHTAVVQASGDLSAGSLATRYAALLDCEEERPCDRLRARALDAGLAPAVRGVYWLALAECAKEPLATFDRDDVPAAAIVARYDALGYDEGPPPPYLPRFGRAIVELAGDPATPAYTLRGAVYDVLSTHDPAAEEAVLRAHAAAATPELRLQLALAAGAARGEKVRALHRRACRAEPDDSGCVPLDDGTPDSEPVPDDGEPTLQPWERGAKEMIDAGHGIWFDVETDTFPNHHDELLARLSHLVRPALDGAVFEELVPADPEDDDSPYKLRAYLDGTRYELEADNLGDWYDLTAVVGLINALLRDRKSDLGCLILQTGDQLAQVVCGRREALRAAIEQGRLRPDGAEE